MEMQTRFMHFLSLQSDPGLHSHYLQRLAFGSGCLSTEWTGGKVIPTNANHTHHYITSTFAGPWYPSQCHPLLPLATWVLPDSVATGILSSRGACWVGDGADWCQVDAWGGLCVGDRARGAGGTHGVHILWRVSLKGAYLALKGRPQSGVHQYLPCQIIMAFGCELL